MTPENAKMMVFDNLSYLDGLCVSRFWGNRTFAELAQCFLLDKLQENEWDRIRQWSGKIAFQPYLTLIAQRILTQFVRQKQGYPRLPKGLPDTSLHQRAFQLLRVQKWTRGEVIEILVVLDGACDRNEIEKTVNLVAEKAKLPLVNRQTESLDDCMEIAAPDLSPEQVIIEKEKKDITGILKQFLETRDEANLPPAIREQIKRLSNYIELSDEDWLFLRMYFVDDLSITQIAIRVGFKGDPYKRYHKMLKEIRKAFEAAGLGKIIAG